MENSEDYNNLPKGAYNLPKALEILLYIVGHFEMYKPLQSSIHKPMFMVLYSLLKAILNIATINRKKSRLFKITFFEYCCIMG